MDKTLTKFGKYLCYVLRHQPDAAGIKLDSYGWTAIDELISAVNKQGETMDLDLLHAVVETDNKQRFAISADGLRIRACQGHSIAIDLELAPCLPPTVLYHGTGMKSLAAIREQGLLKLGRQHVHLSPDITTAHQVGKRHGKPVILNISCRQMHIDGHQFFLSANNVWLTDHVPYYYMTEDL